MLADDSQHLCQKHHSCVFASHRFRTSPEHQRPHLIHQVELISAWIDTVLLHAQNKARENHPDDQLCTLQGSVLAQLEEASLTKDNSYAHSASYLPGSSPP